ncbi:MAG: hypothetical protein RI995_2235 [Bacteroidota bacterium]|jgi:hypothetical protein
MSRLGDQFKLGELFYYFIRVFKKPKEGEIRNFNLRAMHTINKISIIMFLICLIVIVYRFISRQ